MRKLVLAVALIMPTLLSSPLLAEGESKNKQSENPKTHQFEYLFSELKKLTAQYVSNCSDEKARADSGWLSEEACLQDGRIHKVYSHDNQGRATNEFESNDLDNLINAALSGAEILVQETTSATTYKCAASTVFRGERPKVICNSHKFSWHDYTDATEAREIWFHSTTEGVRIYRIINADGQAQTSSVHSSPLTWFIRY